MLVTASYRERPQVACDHPIDLVLAPPDATVPGNPFDVAFDATFWGPAGQALTIPGFYDDERGYVVRFAPTAIGAWHYETHARVTALDDLRGRLDCIANDNPAIHGPLRVDPTYPHHFVLQDGTRYFMLGYEADWLLMIDQLPSRLDRVTAFLDSISRAGFNLVTTNMYAYTCRGWLTEDQERDPRYIKPSLAPWIGGNASPDYTRMDCAFFRHCDQVVASLLVRGIQLHLMIHVYNKQVNWPILGSPDDDRFWRYVVARYQAFCNVIWDPAKESYYCPATYIRERLALLRRYDGYHHLITIHDANVPYNAHSAWSLRWYDPHKELNEHLVDFKSDQIHTDWYADARRNYGAAQRPYVNIEYGYEEGVEDWPTYRVKQDGREVLRRTWVIIMGGGYPNYYYSNTAWNLFVPSPEPPSYSWYRRLADFWHTTAYWQLTPDNTPLGDAPREGVYCRANPGSEYVIWDEYGEGFALTIHDATATLRGEWFNPFTGERQPDGMFSNGTYDLASPWGSGTWAVFHVRG